MEHESEPITREYRVVIVSNNDRRAELEEILEWLNALGAQRDLEP